MTLTIAPRDTSAKSLYTLKVWYEPLIDAFKLQITTRRGKKVVLQLDRKKALRGYVDCIERHEVSEGESITRSIQEVLDAE